MQRDNYIDFLRAIGLISIIMVHCDIPRWLYQINLFNVPLMVIVSGLVADSSIKKNYSSYIFMRFKRLVVPTWIFISLYLVFLYILTKAGLIQFFAFNCNNIISSYCLLDSESGGIGFVWIIRVFLLTMIITPYITLINSKLNRGGYFMCIVLLLATQILLSIPINLIETSVFYKQILLFFVGYQVFIWYGIRLKSLSKQDINVLILILFAISTTMVIYRVFICHIDINEIEYKYPPYFDYQIYGMAFTTLLWKFKQNLSWISNSRILQFIGQNTIWIYFWHIPIVITLNSLLRGHHWLLVFALTVFLSIVFYHLQYKIVKRNNIKVITKYFIG